MCMSAGANERYHDDVDEMIMMMAILTSVYTSKESKLKQTQSKDKTKDSDNLETFRTFHRNILTQEMKPVVFSDK